jgi:hypothetical protein
MTNIYNLFKFLEKTEGRPIPPEAELLYGEHEPGKDIIFEPETGALMIDYSVFIMLPDNLTIKGDLVIENSKEYTALPKNLTVTGNLKIWNTGISDWPEGLTVGRSITFAKSPLEQIPDNLTVNGYLFIRGSSVKELPKGLHVKELLNILETEIETLPTDLKVDDVLIATYTPLAKKYTEKQIKQMCPGIQGSVILK